MGDRGRVVTAVVGAGPAGLLFTLATSLLTEKRGLRDAWFVVLFDKRVDYQRTHRLRIDPAPLKELQQALSDPRFDELIDHLDARGFSPPVNELEHWLSDAVRAVGVQKQQLTIGSDASRGEVDLAGLVDRLKADGTLRRGDVFTVVGADSVHSTVRELVRGDGGLTAHEHQRVARLRITGSALPKTVSGYEKLRLSKALASALDYRLNSNGYAEADLLLDTHTMGSIEKLGANPSKPVLLTDEHLVTIGSPFVARIVQHFAHEIGEPPNDVALQSTFRLEHQYSEHVSFFAASREGDDQPPTITFLVGDAATSLPFFRGMACLASSVHELAKAHCDVLEAATTNSASAQWLQGVALNYERNAIAIREREVHVVESRARLVAIGREIGRISAMLPFPIQVLLLSLDRRKLRGPLARRTPSPEDLFNAIVALGAAAFVVPRMLGNSPLVWPLFLLGLILQFLGGGLFRSSEQFALYRSWSRIIWFAQISALLIGGVTYAFVRTAQRGTPSQWFAAGMWLIMGFAFIPGIYLAERRMR